MADEMHGAHPGPPLPGLPPRPVWVGEAVDLIDDAPSAADVVGTLAEQDEEALASAGRH
ncbi:hypothetical protein OHA48_40835 [Streptomyces sp. NBC_00114]|uniref:hypothetical protein n=1 Tax=unclassified Streptomyces TaxID=2593676 RepID=UPI00324A0A58|nr:hypothetical protein [Streptomyces sp. NBC_00078]